MVAENGVGAGSDTKVTKLNQIEKQADAARRLVEYFVVVSSIERKKKNSAKISDGKDIENQDADEKPNENDMSFSNWRTESGDQEEEDEFSEHHFRPTITARYPETDHADNPLHEALTFFCYPSGGVELRTKPFMPKVRFFLLLCTVYIIHGAIRLSNASIVRPKVALL